MRRTWDDPDEATGIYDPSSSGSGPGAEQWFISCDGTSKQQLSAQQIIEQCQDGRIHEGTLVWHDGLPDWSPLGEVPELAQALRAFSRTPPLPGQAPLAPIPPGQRPSLPSLPSPPSLPPVRGVTTGPPRRFSERVSSVIIDERKARESGSPIGGDPLSLVTVEEPYSLALPGGKRVGLWSVAACAGVLLVSAGIGALLFGDGADEADLQPPVTIDLDGRDHAASAGVEGRSMASKSESSGGGEPSGAPRAQAKKAAKAADEDPARGGTVEETVEPAELPAEPAPVDPAQSKTKSSDDNSPASNGELKSRIDTTAVNRVLGAASAKAGKCSGPAGEGKVKVVFQPSGRVQSVSILTKKYNGTTTGGCVALAFRGVKVPPYEGGNVGAVKGFTIR